MAGGTGSDGEFGLQIAPMLDILFVLLLFFMVCAGAQKHEASITTQLPGSGAADANIPIRIGIDIDGQVTCQNAPVDSVTGDDLPQLIARLRTVMQSNPSQPVIITPSPSTKHQRVVDVLNACAAAGVKNLAFGSSSE
ncbi:MAG: biopolymer transporter ExbD [Methylacidiphilales bacterium]|nr:biopolymer transporter ExbD [Candidatus Methylacidiphilales bacterium]